MGVLEQSIEALKLLSPILDMVPVIGGNLKGAAELASGICEMIKNIKDHREAYEALGQQVSQLLVAIRAELQHAELESAKEMEPKVNKLVVLLKKIEDAVKKRKGIERDSDSPSPTSTSACDRISGWLCNTAIDVRRVAADGEEVDALRKELQEIIQEFNLTTMMRTEMKVDDVKDLVGHVLSELAAARQASEERGKRIERDADIQLLNSLLPITAAAWDMGDTVTCTPLTRVSVLTEVTNWAGNSNSSCVFWMNGLAGTGKSTIARTVCRHLEKSEGRLGASFFVSRQDQARRDASNIVRTIAHQLALHQRLFGEALCSQLRDRPLSTPRSLEKQISDFIVHPAAALPMSDQAPLLVVIDALDECLWDNRGPGGNLVPLLVRGLLTLSGRLKLFLTSRAESAIERMFDQLTTTDAHIVVKLHELDKSMVQADIMTYLRDSFEKLRATMPRRLELSHWPSSDNLEQLVRQSGVLFIYASTVVRFVGSRHHSPRNRLAQVLGQQRVGPLTDTYKLLDDLYLQVLEEAVGIRTRDATEKHRPDEVDMLCRRMKAVVAVIVLAQVPLQVDAVATLSGIEFDDALLAMESISALLLLEDEEPVHVFHPSFPEFILDPDRCCDPRLSVEPDVQHSSLALRCLVVMNESLCYNICDLPDPDVANSDVVDLGTRLSAHVSDAVRYACCHWIFHVGKARSASSQLREELASFCRRHLFHWLEVLSLLRFWSSTESGVLGVIAWCDKFEIDACGIRAAQFLQDTLRILQLYGIPIRSHALHLYHSVLVTMPSCPLLDALVQEHIPDAVPSMLSPRATHLGRAARVLAGHTDWMECVSFSPDGTRIVSGSHDHTIRVWSSVILEELGCLEGHTGHVTSVVFSPDGSCIVSGSSDSTVRVWSAVDLVHSATLEGHQKTISAVAVSPDGTRIISASWDETVCVWCASSFVQLGRLEGNYFSVVFSPKGDRIILSRDTFVRILDASTLVCLVELEATVQISPRIRDYFCSAAMSRDGRHIFAGTSSGIVRIWCTATFQEIATLDQRSGSADCLSVSFDGAFVLSGDSKTGHIHVWNARSYTEITRFHAHRIGVVCVAFSPDGTCFVSCGKDSVPRVWVTGVYDDSESIQLDPWQRHSLQFSADGTHVISRSQQGNLSRLWPWVSRFGRLSAIRLWSVDNFKELIQMERPSLLVVSPDGTQAVMHEKGVFLRVWHLSPFEKLSDLFGCDAYGRDRVDSIAYSPDGTRIVCGMPGGTIESWSASTFEKLSEFDAHSTPVLLVLFSSNGTRLVSRSFGDGIRVWSADTPEKLGEISFHTNRIECVAISPPGTHVMVGLRDRTVRVWSSVTFHELLSLRFDADSLTKKYSLLKHITFSPDGRSILILHDHGEVRTWTCSEEDDSVWREAPFSPAQLPTDGAAEALAISLSKSGWLSCWIHSQRRLIWLPHDRRSIASVNNFAIIGERVAVLTDSGTLTILEFPTSDK